MKQVDKFIIRANQKFNQKFLYDKDSYVSYRINMKIYCPIHKWFLQQPNVHMRSKFGCKLCSDESFKYDILKFTTQSNEIHNNRYNYSKVILKNYKSDIIIICPIHGDFISSADRHINSKNGCPKCNISKGELWTKKFLEKHKIKFIEQYTFADCVNVLTMKFKSMQINDLTKDQYCDKHNIQLIRIDYNFNLTLQT